MNTQPNEVIAKELGKRIAHKRIQAGLTQEFVAEALGIGYEAVSRMERGVAVPNAVCLMELAEIFHCMTDELLHGSSTRLTDQAAYIASMLDGLKPEDRAMVIGLVEQIIQRFKPK